MTAIRTTSRTAADLARITDEPPSPIGRSVVRNPLPAAVGSRNEDGAGQYGKTEDQNTNRHVFLRSTNCNVKSQSEHPAGPPASLERVIARAWPAERRARADDGSRISPHQHEIAPRVSQAPGFVAGHWTTPDDGQNGLSMIVFDSEEAARAGAEMVSAGKAPEAVMLGALSSEGTGTPKRTIHALRRCRL
jgi:hypothetical protein